ncbi:MAG: DUF4041 domain-containing protein [Ancylobacter novellus]|uniref:DUF4041 domain-containing protein n=1 Tax=Ancylobacter novellus TaxID=921 RepID=A0A2W5MNK8_ANCNO|nr:MAG: DUF4041 domain-containing protein [Ancylobacter novellus]
MDSGTAAIFGLLLFVVIPFLLVLTTGLWLRSRRRLSALNARFAGVTAADEELQKVQGETDERRKAMDALEASYAELSLRYGGIVDAEQEVRILKAQAQTEQDLIERLRASYAEKKLVYDRLIREVAIFDDRLAFGEMGVYEPHFDFTDSEAFKQGIVEVRDAQKRMVSNKSAVVCSRQWTVDGSVAKGTTMTNRNIRLTLRAFNNECEAAISNTRWNNANAMEKRILNARKQVDSMNESNLVTITEAYVELKLKELFLTHEYREKLKEEKEERAEAVRAAREEQKLERDMERAEEEERHYAEMLAKAKAEAASISGDQLAAFSDQITILERDLAAAQARFERAQALAQRTRSGYVYIISNIGSFGEEMVKIGLTRRLDPSDRVIELGDASVPFRFDTHAIIYSDDAVALEGALHREFDAVRVNAQNYRKEFFRVSIEAVEEAVERLAPGAPFFRDVEAQEYRETLAKRRALFELPVHDDVAVLPAAI